MTQGIEGDLGRSLVYPFTYTGATILGPNPEWTEDWHVWLCLVSIPLTAVGPKHWGKKFKKLKNVVFFPKRIDLLHYRHEAQENQKHLTLLCHNLSQFCSLTLLPQHL